MARTPFAAWLAGLALLLLAACSDSRTQIRIVGSSTVFPFATAVAENFSRTYPQFLSPIIEATGTGGGIKLFCAGLGTRFPDVVNASRRMTGQEFAACQANGVRDIVELEIGIDGVVLVQSRAAIPVTLSLGDVYRALAATPFGQPQTTQTWRDVNPALPATGIEVIGPPPTSGTRDAFNELYMLAGCAGGPGMAALKAADPARFKAVCTAVREDGKYVDAGENDNLIVQKLGTNPLAIGVLGYSFLERNLDSLRDVPIDGVRATYQTIAEQRYPAARPLFIYVKVQHVKAIHGLREFIDEFVDEQTIGPTGYLGRRGLIAAPSAVRQAMRRRASQLTPLLAKDLQAEDPA